MWFVFASLALKSLLSFPRLMNKLIADFCTKCVKPAWFLIRLKKRTDRSLPRQQTNQYLDFLSRFRPTSGCPHVLWLSWKVYATFMDADCCSEDAPSGHYVGISSAFISFLPWNFIEFIRDFITLFREVEKDAVQLKRKQTNRVFFIVSFNTRYTTISNNTDNIAMKDNLTTTTYVHLS